MRAGVDWRDLHLTAHRLIAELLHDSGIITLDAEAAVDSGLSSVFLPHGLAIDRGLDYPRLAQSFVAQYCARSGKPIHGATCHKHFDRLLRIWPRARFVHIVRDGRDVARSCIGMGWAGNVWHGSERWIAAGPAYEGVVGRTEDSRWVIGVGGDLPESIRPQ